jgi:hypothetical protein
VDCAEIRIAFARGAPPTGPDVDDHAAACAACRALLDGGTLGTLLAEQRATDEHQESVLLARVQARLEGEVGVRAWIRSQSTPRRFALVAIVLAFSTAPALIESAAPRPTSALLTVSLALLGAGLLVALVSALRPLSRPLRPARVLAVAAGSLALPFVLAAIAAADRSAEHMALPRASACFLYGAAVSLPVFVLLRLLDRAEQVNLSSLAVLAGACGLVANFILRLHCPSEEPLHLLLGHATIGVTWLFLAFAPSMFRRS